MRRQRTWGIAGLLALGTSLGAAPQVRIALPREYRTGDGQVIPVQREWVEALDAAAVEGLPVDERPFRHNQRAPVLVHTEERAGRHPIYYFRDVRWRQDAQTVNGKPVLRALFTTVRVDMEKVKEAYFCLKPFEPRWLVGHAAIELTMEPGGLTTLDGEDGGAFVISFEAHMRVGQAYGLVSGQLGRFPIVYVAGTWDDFLFKSIRIDKSVVKRWRLALSHEELQRLERAIGRAVVADHSGERYNTLHHSCLTAALELLNEVLGAERRMKLEWLGGLIANPAWTLPALADRSLRRKGLIVGDLETFGDESLVGE